MIIINRLLEELRKMRNNISENSGKMKIILLSNITKSEKSEKSTRKISESKTNAKKNLYYNFCNKNNHEKQIYWEKYSHMKSKRKRNTEK